MLVLVRKCPSCGSKENHICLGWIVDAFRINEMEALVAAGPGAEVCRICAYPVLHERHDCVRVMKTLGKTFDASKHVKKQSAADVGCIAARLAAANGNEAGR